MSIKSRARVSAEVFSGNTVMAPDDGAAQLLTLALCSSISTSGVYLIWRFNCETRSNSATASGRPFICQGPRSASVTPN